MDKLAIDSKLIALFGDRWFENLDEMTRHCICEWFNGLSDGLYPKKITIEEIEEYIRDSVNSKIQEAYSSYIIDM